MEWTNQDKFLFLLQTAAIVRDVHMKSDSARSVLAEALDLSAAEIDVGVKLCNGCFAMLVDQFMVWHRDFVLGKTRPEVA